MSDPTSPHETWQRQWITDGVGFEFTEEKLTIRNRAGESSRQWLVSLVLFGLVFFVGSSFLWSAAHDILARGLLEDGHSGWKAYAESVAGLLLILAVAGGVMLAWARPVFGGHEIMVLQAGTTTLINVDFGMTWRRRTYPSKEMDEIEYTVVASSDTTSIYGIRFRVRGSRISVFRYIKPDAAAEVIQAMRSFRSQA